MNLFYLWVISKTLLCGCGPDVRRYDFSKVRSKYTIDKIAVLPPEVKESSGLALASDGHSFWTHNDSGSPAELYRFGLDGTLLQRRSFGQLPAIDWEELAQERSGRLFIGDIGNNDRLRKELTIRILPKGWEQKLENEDVETITFRYAPTSSDSTGRRQSFNSEAFFFHNDSLFVFTKASTKKPRYTTLYKIPALPGDYTVYPSDSIRLNETITAADISPDGKQFVLLSYGKLFFFEIHNRSVNFSRPSYCLKKYLGQSEAIVYRDSTSLLITNEGRTLFQVGRK
jgi:hypothetical protein